MDGLTLAVLSVSMAFVVEEIVAVVDSVCVHHNWRLLLAQQHSVLVVLVEQSKCSSLRFLSSQIVPRYLSVVEVESWPLFVA